MTTLTDELRDYLFEAMTCVEPEIRRRSHWVMNTEWFLECRKLTDTMGAPLFMPSWSLSGPTMLFGFPIEIRADGGAPHLEAPA